MWDVPAWVVCPGEGVRDDPPLGHPTLLLDAPRRLRRPMRCRTSARGWAVHQFGLWLGCSHFRLEGRPSCGPSHLGAGCPFSRWVIPALHGTSHVAGMSQFGWVVPVRVGCPDFHSSFDWVVPSCGSRGHPTLARAVPFHWAIPALHGTFHAAGLSQLSWAVLVRVGCPTFDWGSSQLQVPCNPYRVRSGGGDEKTPFMSARPT